MAHFISVRSDTSLILNGGNIEKKRIDHLHFGAIYLLIFNFIKSL